MMASLLILRSVGVLAAGQWAVRGERSLSKAQRAQRDEVGADRGYLNVLQDCDDRNRTPGDLEPSKASSLSVKPDVGPVLSFVQDRPVSSGDHRVPVSSFGGAERGAHKVDREGIWFDNTMSLNPSCPVRLAVVAGHKWGTRGYEAGREERHPCRTGTDWYAARDGH